MHPGYPRRLLRTSESKWCLRANALCERRFAFLFFAAVSRLGDGVFWYALMLGLALFGGGVGRAAALHLAIVALVSLALYKALKRWTKRPRPARPTCGSARGSRRWTNSVFLPGIRCTRSRSPSSPWPMCRRWPGC